MRYTNTIAHGKAMGKVAALAAIPMVLAYASCSRDHLYYETSLQPNVQLNIDWSRTAFSPSHPSYDPDNPLNGVTVFAYDAATQRLVAEFPPDADWSTPQLRLAPGTYDLVIINDSRYELPNINLNTEQNFEDFSAYIAADTVFNNEYPDYLTVSSVLNVLFEPPYNDYFYDQPEEYIYNIVTMEIPTVQHPVTKKVNINVYVKGVNYCRGMQPSYITGLAKSVNLSTEIPGKQTAVFAYNLVNREYRSSDYTEALLTQTFNTYSFNKENLLAGQKFEVTLNFVLVNNEVHTVKADVTEQFVQWLKNRDIDGNIYDDIDIYLELTLPPTDPSSSDVEGFAPETLPWNDIEQEITL